MDRTAIATRLPPSVRRAAFFAALAFVLYFSLCPSETVEENFSKPVQSFDWLFHTVTYAALGALAVLAFLRRPASSAPLHSRLHPRLLVLLLLASLGCALELGQRLLPFVGRSCSLSDALHNAFGAALGAFLAPSSLLLPRPTP